MGFMSGNPPYTVVTEPARNELINALLKIDYTLYM